jgi:large subunit ribosomal protein L20
MTRVKTATAGHRRRKKTLRQARGYRGARSKLNRTARTAVMRAQAQAYRGRKLKKRDFRALWITRIRAAVKQEGLSYSRFMNLLTGAGIAVNRKVLAEMAVRHPEAFSRLVESVRKIAA